MIVEADPLETKVDKAPKDRYLHLDFFGLSLQGTITYPTKREVRKIIDSIPCRLVSGYVIVPREGKFLKM